MIIGRVIVGIGIGIAFLGVIDRIQKALEKGDFEKAMDLIEKGYEKEPDNPGIFYYHATVLFNPNYTGFHADSARLLINQALEKYEKASNEELDEIKEAGLNEEVFEKLVSEIRDYQYGQVLVDLSIQSIAEYRSKYPGSTYEKVLIFKRDSMAFRRVRMEDTQLDYSDFIQNYPNSIFRAEADSLLDRLRYLELVNNGYLQDYKAFRTSYPATNWMHKVEEYILSLSTASHEPSTFEEFIGSSYTPVLQKKAADVLYYLSNDVQHPSIDSLRQAEILSRVELFPVMDLGKFGFHSREGSNQIPYSYNNIQEILKCEVVKDDWLFVKEDDQGKIILKNGKTLIADVDHYTSLSESLALIEKNGYKFLYHKSGFRVMEDPIEAAHVFENGWIRVERNGKWGLFTLLGLSIADIRYDDIYTLGSFWVFERNDLLAVYTTEEILREVEEEGLSLEFKFDDLELVNDELLIGFRDERECLLNKDLDFLIPWGEYEIFPDPAGWYLRSSEGYYMYNSTDERVMDQTYSYLESNDGWLALRTDTVWMLMARKGSFAPERGYDSLKLINANAALVFKGEEKLLTFNTGNEIKLTEHSIQSFQNRPEYLMIKNKDALGLYNQKGESVFDGKYDDLRFVNDTLLKVSVKGKQGVIDTEGEFLLNPIFDSLDEKDGLILTLYKGSIGCYDLFNNVLISPEFDSRITKISNHYLVKKEGKYGLIDANKDEVLSFQFDDIKQWNDSSYLVSEEGENKIINKNEENLVGNIESMELIYERDAEKVFRIFKDGKFGLISNQEGFILKPEYTDILNIGNEDNPLFFADQHLSNAGFHVVSYVNLEGELVFSKAYRREEFDKIICDD